MADGMLFGEQPQWSGFFSTVWDEPGPGSFFPRPRWIDPQLLQAVGFGRLGRTVDDVPFWTDLFQGYPDVDRGMPMVLPPADFLYNMPVYRTEEEVRPRDRIPPWADDRGLHMDDKNPRYNQNVSPGWGL